jgi:hypothetical protein
MWPLEPSLPAGASASLPTQNCPGDLGTMGIWQALLAPVCGERHTEAGSTKSKGSNKKAVWLTIHGHVILRDVSSGGSGLVQTAWFQCGSAVVDWLRHGSGLGHVWSQFGSSLVQNWSLHGSGLVQECFMFGSYSYSCSNWHSYSYCYDYSWVCRF